jgi:hypothetical protein
MYMLLLVLVKERLAHPMVYFSHDVEWRQYALSRAYQIITLTIGVRERTSNASSIDTS